jgi:hypothetical protein
MVEIDTGSEPQASPHTARRGIFTDGASGLETAIFNAGAEAGRRTEGNSDFGSMLVEAGHRFDFIILAGLSAAGADWDPHLFAAADLMLFALGPGEAASEAASLLRHRLEDDQIRRSAMFTIMNESAPPAGRRLPQTEAAGGTHGRQQDGPVMGTASLRRGKDGGY